MGTYPPPLPGSIPGLGLNPTFRLPMSDTMSGYPPVSSVAGSVCRDPYCKDPTCPTAVYSAYMAQLRGLPPGYMELVQAQHMARMGLGALPSSVPSSLSSSVPGGPYICNWMSDRDYCGKRHTSAEELLVHLKTHTNLSTSSSTYTSLLSQSLLHQRPGHILPSFLHTSRYSPYHRPGPTLPPSLPTPGGLSSPVAGLTPSLGHLASLYTLYGARL